MGKWINNIVCSAFALSIFSCSQKTPNNIEGTWIAKGYTCYNRTDLTETILVSKQGNQYLAVKITGDDCIPAGDTTWYVETTSDLITYAGMVKGINKQTLQVEWQPCEIEFLGGRLFLSVQGYDVLIMHRDTEEVESRK
ncbi:MAG: hypothetical protein JJ975_04950 [Bacteroidia bacterium]|nr:hypothetical protein [Bacteroidia bacterium]